ncbi:MAG: hypothetical protein U0872_15610 [Planctomycetaceae bacterium]
MSLFGLRPFFVLIFALVCAVPAAAREPWTAAQANAWYARQPWLVGCNFAPSTAINQLEMWQAETFDPKTIDRELGWAHDLGFNSVRVFLHHLLWQQDADGFLKRVDEFLAIADKHQIKGSCWCCWMACGSRCRNWDASREPRPHVHNSGWVQSPGRGTWRTRLGTMKLSLHRRKPVRRFRTDPARRRVGYFQ